MRVAGVVRQLVVLAVGGDPENRSALERQRAADREEILERFRALEAAVRMQAVVAEADAEADRHPMQHERDDEVLPGEEPERHDGEHVERQHETTGNPVDVRNGVNGLERGAKCRQRNS